MPSVLHTVLRITCLFHINHSTKINSLSVLESSCCNRRTAEPVDIHNKNRNLHALSGVLRFICRYEHTHLDSFAIREGCSSHFARSSILYGASGINFCQRYLSNESVMGDGARNSRKQRTPASDNGADEHPKCHHVLSRKTVLIGCFFGGEDFVQTQVMHKKKAQPRDDLKYTRKARLALTSAVYRFLVFFMLVTQAWFELWI